MKQTGQEGRSRGRELLWSSLLWLLAGFAVYVLSYGPAVWIEPKIGNKHVRSMLERIYVPAGYVLFETPLRPFADWYVSVWVDLSLAAK
jgi:hypothetical protein